MYNPALLGGGGGMGAAPKGKPAEAEKKREPEKHPSASGSIASNLAKSTLRKAERDAIHQAYAKAPMVDDSELSSSMSSLSLRSISDASSFSSQSSSVDERSISSFTSSWSDSTSETGMIGPIDENVLKARNYVRACKMTDVPNNKGIKLKLQGSTIAVFRRGERLYAMKNSCPHAGFDLALGDIEDFEGRTCVSCPKHYFKFDVTTGYRVFKGGTTGPLKAKVYPTCIFNDHLYIKLKTDAEKKLAKEEKKKLKEEKKLKK